MDDDLEHLEAELKQLEPRAPSPESMRRIEAELARPVEQTKPAEIRWVGLTVLAAAAAVAVMFMRTARPDDATMPRNASVGSSVQPPSHGAVAAKSEPELKPIADESLLVSARDEGLVTLDDGTRARRQRLEFVETITWKNPRTNASLIWSVPREEVRVVPISFQ